MTHAWGLTTAPLELQEVDGLIPILQMRKLKLREVEECVRMKLSHESQV